MSVHAISPERRQSNELLRAWCADITGEVLSVGSGGDIDKQGGTYREYFRRTAQYTTSDIDPSLGCDLVVDVRRMQFTDGSFDAVFCSGVLEHVDDIITGVSEVRRVLRPGGVFLVGVPFQQQIHRAPNDFWRVTDHGMRYLLRTFTQVEVVPIGPPAFPFAYWARAVKP